LQPSISIEPYASQDPHRPFAQQFYLQNNSVYDIQAVEPLCGIGNVRAGRTTMGDFSIMNPFDFAGSLAPGAKTNVTCPLDQLFGDFGEYHELQITIWAKYNLPFGISSCKATNFSGEPATGGTFIWTYRGSPDCESLKKRALRPN
jgi:hypothetical protein